MHLKGQALASASLSINASRFSQLPFLYHTETLESFFCSINKCTVTPYTRKGQRQFSSTRKIRANASHSPSRSAIPFEPSMNGNDFQTHSQSYFSEPEGSKTNVPIPFSRVRGSTITAAEKAIFDRIFKDISQSISTQKKEEDFDNELEEDNHNVKSFEEIFEGAISNLEERGTISREGHAKPVFRPQATLKNQFGKVQYHDKHAEMPSSTSIEASEIESVETKHAETDDIYEAARQEHKAYFTAMLEKAQTDIEVWKILEAEVFSLTNILELQSGETGPSSLKEEKKLKGKSSRGKKNAVAPSKESTTTKFDPKLSILQNNYSTYCLEALRLLRREFPTSPYALQVLPAIKRQGPISYVLGASPNLYNEIIFLKWTRYTDLHSIADLLQEMCKQGVEANEVTLEILKAISRERRAGLTGIKNAVLPEVDDVRVKRELTGVWWKMRAVQEAWYRILPIFTIFKKEHSQRSFRMSVESGNGEEIFDERGEEQENKVNKDESQKNKHENYVETFDKATPGVVGNI